MTISEKEKSKKAGKRVLLYILGAFIIVLTVNAFFIYAAIKTFPNEVPYKITRNK